MTPTPTPITPHAGRAPRRGGVAWLAAGLVAALACSRSHVVGTFTPDGGRDGVTSEGGAPDAGHADGGADAGADRDAAATDGAHAPETTTEAGAPDDAAAPDASSPDADADADEVRPPPTVLACVPACTGGAGVSCERGLCQDGASRWTTLGGDAHHSGFAAHETGHPPLTQAFQMPVSAGNTLWPAVADAQAVYVASRGTDLGTSWLAAFSASNGHGIWTQHLDSASGVATGLGQPTLEGGRLYLVHRDPDVGPAMKAFATATGTVQWTSPFASQLEKFWAPAAVAGRLYFNAGPYGGMRALNEADGSLVFFQSQFNAGDAWSPLPLGDSVYAFVQGLLTAYDPLTGDRGPWTFVEWTGSQTTMETSAATDGRLIYVISQPRLYAFRPGPDPVPQWSAFGDYKGMPAVANGVVYALSSGQLRANDALTGELKATFPANGRLIYPPVVAGRWVYVSSYDEVFAFDTLSETESWRGGPGGWLSIAAGKLYVAQDDGVLTAYALTP